MRYPIRVLHLRDSPWVDGPGRTILETASHLDRSKIDYHVGALISHDDGKHPLVDALQARGTPVHKLRDRGGIDGALIDAIVALINDLNIDVLHTSEFRSNVLGLLCRRKRPVKLVATSHGWIANDARGRVYRMLDKVLLRGFDTVILVSGAMRRLVPRWWLPDERVLILPNALVLESYGRGVVNAARRQLDPAGVVSLLNVGRLSPEKGQDLLLRAVADLIVDYPRLKLSFAGIGPEESALRALAKQLGIEHNVEFLGYVSDMPRLYAQSDLLVQSSLTEGMPNIVLEAAYLRVPMVATRVGGTDEIVEHGKSAWLVRPGSMEELREGIRRFLSGPQAFVRMAALAHERVLEQFSFDVRTRRLTEFYELIAADQPS